MNATGVCLRAAVALGAVGCLPANGPRGQALTDSVREARALDQEGVAAYEAGRYRDAILYFDASFDHGGPPSERWNSAKCHIRLDEPAQAEALLVEYAKLPGITSDERREAKATVESLRRRPSPLTVLSTPLGLAVTVDGHRLGVTPLTTSVSAGDHTVLVERDLARQDGTITARFGRAILVEAHL